MCPLDRKFSVGPLEARLQEPGDFPAVALTHCIVRIPTGSRQEVRIQTGSSGAESCNSGGRLVSSLLEIAKGGGLNLLWLWLERIKISPRIKKMRVYSICPVCMYKTCLILRRGRLIPVLVSRLFRARGDPLLDHLAFRQELAVQRWKRVPVRVAVLDELFWAVAFYCFSSSGRFVANSSVTPWVIPHHAEELKDQLRRECAPFRTQGLAFSVQQARIQD
jgi:hypothetical protein